MLNNNNFDKSESVPELRDSQKETEIVVPGTGIEEEEMEQEEEGTTREQVRKLAGFFSSKKHPK